MVLYVVTPQLHQWDGRNLAMNMLELTLPHLFMGIFYKQYC